MRNIDAIPVKRFENLIGCTLTKVFVSEFKDQMFFLLLDGREFSLGRSEFSCAHVAIESIEGNFDDLLHSPITMADEVSNECKNDGESSLNRSLERWTFQKIGTVKGVVMICWYGLSNGDYSVSVDFEESDYIDDDDEE